MANECQQKFADSLIFRAGVSKLLNNKALLEAEAEKLGQYAGEIQRRFKDWLDDLDKSQAELASKSGIAESTITHIKHGKLKLTSESLEKLAEAAECDPVEILGGVHLGRKYVEATNQLRSILKGGDERAKAFAFGCIYEAYKMMQSKKDPEPSLGSRTG